MKRSFGLLGLALFLTTALIVEPLCPVSYCASLTLTLAGLGAAYFSARGMVHQFKCWWRKACYEV